MNGDYLVVDKKTREIIEGDFYINVKSRNLFELKDGNIIDVSKLYNVSTTIIEADLKVGK